MAPRNPLPKGISPAAKAALLKTRARNANKAIAARKKAAKAKKPRSDGTIFGDNGTISNFLRRHPSLTSGEYENRIESRRDSIERARLKAARIKRANKPVKPTVQEKSATGKRRKPRK